VSGRKQPEIPSRISRCSGEASLIVQAHWPTITGARYHFHFHFQQFQQGSVGLGPGGL